MIIIVEGIDRVGKTTIVERISKKRNIKVYKHIGDFNYSKMDNENETDKMLQILEIAKIGQATMIFDRFHFTDFVYGVLERHYDFMNAIKNKEQIENVLRDMNVKLIYVRPTNIQWSSDRHGSDLTRHLVLMDMLYNESIIKDKIDTDFYHITNVEKQVQEWFDKSIFN